MIPKEPNDGAHDFHVINDDGGNESDLLTIFALIRLIRELCAKRRFLRINLRRSFRRNLLIFCLSEFLVGSMVALRRKEPLDPRGTQLES